MAIKRPLVLAALCCSAATAQQWPTVVDIDGNVYRIATFGSQTWMAENLAVTRDPAGAPIPSYCYEDDPAHCEQYGRLYTWDVAMRGETAERSQGICPGGWHLPSDAEWQVLVEHFGGAKVAGGELIAQGRSGFEALLGGGADFRGDYLYLGEHGLFWTSTEVSPERAYHQGASANGESTHFAAMKGARISVRCVRDG